MKIVVFLLILLWGGESFVWAQEVKVHTLANQLIMPNRIIADKSFLYISNVANNTSNTIKRGNAFISKVSKTGVLIESHFIKNLDYPQGMVVLNNILYVMDSDRIKGFNLRTKKQVFNLQINGESHLNDIIYGGANTLFVSGRTTGVIFVVDLKRKSYSTFVVIPFSLCSPYRLAYYGTNLYVITSCRQEQARILQIDIHRKNITHLSSLSGKFSDIAVTDKGEIFVSKREDKVAQHVEEESVNVRNILYKITPEGRVFEIYLEKEIRNFSDFLIDSQTLWFLDSENAHLLQIVFPKTAV
ncbi:hypothetical protein CQA66_02150 [Helicobacter aurati]|uniref:Uncharacterized protein n=1 Tax=Helicobacter aurati TaxID=137778 RepID=A0A3D8J6E0_9HELI|nr:hypothetical protein [Helicobacter aurati]RDU73059.1 hypothetical protein CQA66_02150 [Helicobacter aurati]